MNQKYYFYEIKKSKFYTYLFEINNFNEFNQKLLEISKQYKKINHICYFCKYLDKKTNQIIIKFYESTEPRGVFYKSIIKIFEFKNINNIAIIVCRKFGGIKLGIGLLSRSYSYGINKILNS